MKRKSRALLVLSAILFVSNISFAHADDISDQVTAYRNAKSAFDNAMNVYSNAKSSRMAAYKDAVQARNEAAKALQSARKIILDSFKNALDKANSDFATARSAAKSASDKQIANAARKAAIATASAIRDAALSQLPDLGPEPTKPAKK